MKKLKLLLVTGFLLAGWISAAAQITEKPGFGKYAITGATVHTVTNGTLENATILIDGETISYVGSDANTAGYEVMDASGKHVYPGFIDSWTSLGLVEISAVAVTVDNREIGQFKPHVRAFTAFNPHSAAVPVTRVSGVTTVLSAPAGGNIPGKAALMNLWGYSPDSMAVAGNAAAILNLPSSTRGGWWDDRSDREIKEDYERNIKAINDYLDKARFYDEMMSAYEADPDNKEQPDTDRQMEAMREVVNGEIPVIISVSREQAILDAIEWTGEQEDMRFIFEGVEEGWRVADELAESGIPVIVSTLYNTTRDYDNYQRPYQNPGLLHDAGVTVMIGTGETENVRNAPFHAGYAATYGLGVEEAVKAMTINPARAFGVEDHLGSLEEGKQATLFISDGDPFEPLNQIEQVFISGYKIPMSSRHSQLYEEFLDRDAVND